MFRRRIFTKNEGNKPCDCMGERKKNESGLSKDSVALIHQIVVVDKFRLEDKISKLPKNLLSKIEDEIDYVTKE